MSFLPGWPYLRRTIVIIVAGGILLVCGWWLTPWLREQPRVQALLPAPLRIRHVLWVTLSLEIVFAIYKWGVGDWSRYTPPATVSRAGTPVDDRNVKGVAPKADNAGATAPAPPPA